MKEPGLNLECPICAEELDETDLALLPCPCDYQICLWCLQRIRERENNKCPQCRRDYTEESYRRVNPTRLIASLKSKHDAAIPVNIPDPSQEPAPENVAVPRGAHMPRAVPPVVCRLSNIPKQLANAQVLSSFRYFGKYGRLMSVVVMNANVFLTFGHPDNATFAIQDFNKFIASSASALGSVENVNLGSWKLAKLQMGAGRHCLQSLRGLKCAAESCPFTHININKSPKCYWKAPKRLVLGGCTGPSDRYGMFRSFCSDSLLAERVANPEQDSLFEKSCAQVANSWLELGIPRSVISAIDSPNLVPQQQKAVASTLPLSARGTPGDPPAAQPRKWRTQMPANPTDPRKSMSDETIFPELENSASLIRQEIGFPHTTVKSQPRKTAAPDRLETNVLLESPFNPNHGKSSLSRDAPSVQAKKRVSSDVASNMVARPCASWDLVFISRPPDSLPSDALEDVNDRSSKPTNGCSSSISWNMNDYQLASKSGGVGMKVYLPPPKLKNLHSHRQSSPAPEDTKSLLAGKPWEGLGGNSETESLDIERRHYENEIQQDPYNSFRDSSRNESTIESSTESRNQLGFFSGGEANPETFGLNRAEKRALFEKAEEMILSNVKCPDNHLDSWSLQRGRRDATPETTVEPPRSSKAQQPATSPREEYVNRTRMLVEQDGQSLSEILATSLNRGGGIAGFCGRQLAAQPPPSWEHRRPDVFFQMPCSPTPQQQQTRQFGNSESATTLELQQKMLSEDYSLHSSFISACDFEFSWGETSKRG